MSATEAARNFSDLLNRIATGEEIEIVRNGAEVAVMIPARPRLMSAARFREMMAGAPEIDDAFLDELRAARAALGTPEDPWAS